ncbi:MAG: hypothetical protein ACRBN8_11900 [Nannocystales bacterium]
MPARLRRVASFPSLVAAVGAVLLPKCPACLAAYLAAMGLGAGTAGVLASFARPGLFAVAGASMVAWVALRLRRRNADNLVTPRCSVRDAA